MELLEISLTLGVVLLQVYYFIKTLRKTQELSDLFPSEGFELAPFAGIMVEGEGEGNTREVQIIIPRQSWSTSFQEIVEDTNQYLVNNKGAAANFSIIQDIAERINRAVEISISATVAIPLYVGLLGTMFGIVLGLWLLGSELTDASLQSLLAGVKIAMTGSFTGLLLTLINSAKFFRQAKFHRDIKKNQYYTFVQTALLPVLTEDMANSLKNLEFQMGRFNRDFSQNVDKLDRSVQSVSSNLSIQHQIVEQIGRIDLLKITKANLTMFDKLSDGVQYIETFNRYLETLNEYHSALSETIATTDEHVERVGHVMEEVGSLRDDVKEIFQDIHDGVEDSQKIMNFLKTHYASLESISDTTLELLASQEKQVKQMGDSFQNFLGEYGSQNKDRLTQIAAESERKLKEALSDTSFIRMEGKIEGLDEQLKHNEIQQEVNTALIENKLNDLTEEVGEIMKGVESFRNQNQLSERIKKTKRWLAKYLPWMNE